MKANKKIVVICVFAVLFIIGFAVVTILIKNYKSPKELEITKRKSAGVPFKWTYVIEDPTIVECSRVYLLEDEKKSREKGAPIYNNYVFKGLKEGVTHVTFKFVSIVDKDYPPEEDTYTIKVDKNLNISSVVIDENK